MLKKTLFLPLLVTLPILVQVMSCNSCERLEETYYRVGRGGGVMNDSMALLSRCVKNYYFTAGLAGGERYEDIGCHLLLVDIRYEKIYWEKEIPIKYSVGLSSILDSVLFFSRRSYDYDISHSYSIDRIATQRLNDENSQDSWQVNLNPKKINLIGEGWKYSSEIRIRTWKDGLILANYFYYFLSNIQNHYALLDTISGTMELWQPSGEFEWLNECMDAKWSSIGGLCLKEMADTLGFVLLRNGVDTLAVRYMPYKPFVVNDEEYPLVFNGNSIVSWSWVYLINERGQVSEQPLDVWLMSRDGFYFKNLHSSSYIHYNKKIVY